MGAGTDRYLVVPAPIGPRGLGYMNVVVGLAIPSGAAHQAGAEQLIDWLTRPAQQRAAADSLNFFPAVTGVVPTGPLAREQRVENTYQVGLHRVPTTQPIVGAGSDDFTKYYQETFQRIVVQHQDIRTVLSDEARNLQGVVDAARAPCSGPDRSSGASCR